MVPSAPMAGEESIMPSGGILPLQRAVRRVERIEVIILRPDIDRAVRADGRGGAM